MIEGIVFDMDGVLIDSHPVHRIAWRKFLSTVGKSVGDEGLSFILAGRRREEILRHFLGDLSESKIAEYGHQKDLFFEENFQEVRLIPGVSKFLEALETAGLEAGIATSASSARTWGTLRRLELDQRFTAVVTGDDVDAGKPDPAVYQLAAQRMNHARRCCRISRTSCRWSRSKARIPRAWTTCSRCCSWAASISRRRCAC